MPAYMIAQLAVRDREAYARYAEQVGATVAPFGGRLLVATSRANVLEGTRQYPRTLIGEFPTMESARAWYESPSYRQIQPLRAASTEGVVFLVDGFKGQYTKTTRETP